MEGFTWVIARLCLALFESRLDSPRQSVAKWGNLNLQSQYRKAALNVVKGFLARDDILMVKVL